MDGNLFRESHPGQFGEVDVAFCDEPSVRQEQPGSSARSELGSRLTLDPSASNLRLTSRSGGPRGSSPRGSPMRRQPGSGSRRLAAIGVLSLCALVSIVGAAQVRKSFDVSKPAPDL